MQCEVEFPPSGEVVIYADIARPTASDEACFRQCIHAVSLHSPNSFRAQMTYRNKPESMHIEVTVLGQVAQDIPRLQDMSKLHRTLFPDRTAGAGASHTRKRKRAALPRATIPKELPVWGLISVLLLKEKLVTMDEWLGTQDCDADLPRQTLQVSRTQTHLACSSKPFAYRFAVFEDSC